MMKFDPTLTSQIHRMMRFSNGTDQMGESRLDRNAKRFFVELHRKSDPAHKLEAAY